MLNSPDERTAVKATQIGAMQSLVKPIAPDLLAETATALFDGGVRRDTHTDARRHATAASRNRLRFSD